MEGSISVSKLETDKKFLSKSEFKAALSQVLGITSDAVITGVGYDGDRFVVEVMKQE